MAYIRKAAKLNHEIYKCRLLRGAGGCKLRALLIPTARLVLTRQLAQNQEWHGDLVCSKPECWKL